MKILSKLSKWFESLILWAIVLGFIGSFLVAILLFIYSLPGQSLSLLICLVGLIIFRLVDSKFPVKNDYESPVEHLASSGFYSGGLFGGLYTTLIIGWGNPIGFLLSYRAFGAIVLVSVFASIFGAILGQITGKVFQRLLGEATAEKPFTWQRMRDKRLFVYSLMFLMSMIVNLACAPLLISVGERFAIELGFTYRLPQFVIIVYLIPSLIASLSCVYVAHRYMFKRHLRLIGDRLLSGKSKAKNEEYYRLMDEAKNDADEFVSESEGLVQRSEK